ncbi:unnamed protein product [Urochloa decumbens]|uniref:DUF1618 domain-containing protein n=1 Tax=Urochloa decumbens TaxID=240449 RepID=A0ABC9BYI5_9POAL
METLANKRQRRWLSESDSPAAAGPACWLIVNSCIDAAEGSASDAKTRAASCGSSGKPFSVSLRVAAPPACCSLHLDWLGGGGGGQRRHGKNSSAKSEPEKDIRVIAGHDDALLIRMRVPDPNPTTTTFDYFIYEAGAARRPPSLSLLPGCNIPEQFGYRNPYDPTPRFRHLSMHNTGILRRRGDLLAMCQLEKTCHPPIYDTAELCMLRIGVGDQWINRRLPIVEGSTSSSKLQPWRMRHYIPQAAVPVGNRFLCWVDYNHGFILCDMGMAAAAAEEEVETPKLLRYVPLPAVTPPPRHDDGYRWPHGCYTLGAAGPDIARFVSVSPRRCGDGSISSSFNVTTWTMTLSTEEATAWVKDDDVVLDCDDLIRNPNPNPGDNKHLLVEYPIVSSDDPDVIYFKVGAMAAAINTRTNKLLPVVPSGTRDVHKGQYEPPRLITAKLCW